MTARPVYGGPDGHGRYGILDRDEQGRVLCHECGRWWQHLATHLAGTHGIRAADYRRTHGLSTGTALIGARTRAALRAGWERNADTHTAALDRGRNLDAARARMGPGQWAPEAVAGRRARTAARRVDLTPEQSPSSAMSPTSPVGSTAPAL
ncbi:MAG: MucR family transcriptional regulator [Dehalococcoidia bacterium]